MDLKNKNVVFVGGLGAIGYETCKLILRMEIETLYILDLVENKSAVEYLQTLNAACKVKYLKFDITDKACIKSVLKSIVAETKYIDMLINGAGILCEHDVERTININLTGLINTTLEAMLYMNQQNGGRGGLIANIASISGLDPLSCAVAYSASKFGVVGFTRAMSDSHYFKVTGVAITAICPALTESPLKNNAFVDYSFEYSKPLVENFKNVFCQSAALCAEHLVKVIEANKNGSVWISDGDLTEVEFHTYWKVKFIKKALN